MTPYLAELASNRLDLVLMLGLLLGGLALFLLGLEFMTAGLKAIAGNRLQTLIGMLTANRFRGVLTGALVTALLNSSTITTVLMVGFVSAGLMTLAQSVPMIMGANIGSTVTAQIIAFDVSKLTPFMLAAGFLLHAFSSRRLVKQIGGAVMGLGLLFLGIQFMGDAMRPLRTYQPFIDAMQDMENPVLGIVVGAIFTAIVQSSAATLAIVIALGGQGLMPLEAGIALILGANVGTCGTALLAAIGKSAEAVQVGIVHLLFNVVGVLFWVFFIPQMADLARYVSPSHPELQGLARLAAETPRQVANTHTIFSVVNTLVLIWFTGPIAKLAQLIAPRRGPLVKPAGEPVYLDESSLTVPSLGLQRVRLELARLGQQVLDIVRDSARLLADGDLDDISHLLDRKQDADRLASAILQYIGRLSQVEHSAVEGERIVGFARIASILASISGITGTNLAAVSQRRSAEPGSFTPLSDDATSRFVDAVVLRLERAIGVIGEPGDDADDVLETDVPPVKEKIQALAATARQSVFGRLRLADRKDVVSYQLVVDLIEQFRQIAQLSKAISKTVREFG
ncbi:Na/Pi cotransporter family protein [Paraburkholderia caballeronis]|uniref:Phosphate:Na+ symporter n=1 Tax=Paraburkholderia caballeronis TaxID=416943 RepID=A0A1H7UAF2_9BURK|nr:Na/Pi cotransporter family protein [Paraburkholderia caballeronis]PXW23316.1 phosphate:Na+ symporter [Paraburkholderia caballeronis]PXW98309.1 phosphate:Na+ symporter [Paraburkholderia caballeronis]RAJ95039.1 phosphate:Na+ symporter [Paraburkholderia caballeronis]SEC60298.1 phosphate:Na+ symporter [Paraburkholderia caballeronis]SEL93716.1 phosphate:Na+ symporter [Paraburkholderia caballeronis]